MFGLNSGNPLKQKIESLKFSSPSATSRKSYNKLVGLVESLEVKEPKWETLLERAEGGEIDKVQVEVLEKNMEQAHQEFLNRLSEFESRENEAISETRNTKEAERMGLIEQAVEDMGERAEQLDEIIERTAKAENKQQLEKIRKDLEKEKKASIQELEKLKENLRG